MSVNVDVQKNTQGHKQTNKPVERKVQESNHWFKCGVINNEKKKKGDTTHSYHLDSTLVISHGDNLEQISKTAAITKRQQKEKRAAVERLNEKR